MTEVLERGTFVYIGKLLFYIIKKEIISKIYILFLILPVIQKLNIIVNKNKNKEKCS